jgi:hypothetical protein
MNRDKKPQSAVEAVAKRIEALGIILATKRAAVERGDRKALEILDQMDDLERRVSDELAILIWESAQVHADKITKMVTLSGSQAAGWKEQ